MRISSINRTNFMGRDVYYPSRMGEEGLKKLQWYYPNSLVEKTLGTYHSTPRNSAYFADPMEPIADVIKERVDFVIYDNEPKYPDIEEVRKNYLEHNRTNYREQFENRREYFYRREMGGYANVAEAKEEQRRAAECTGLYDRAGDLRYKKEMAEDEIKVLESDKANIKAGLENTKKELNAQKELKTMLQEHIKTLEKMQNPYDEIQELYEKSVENETRLNVTAVSRISLARGKAEQVDALKNGALYNEGIEAYPYDNLKYGKYEDTVKTYDSIFKIRKDFCVNTSEKPIQRKIKGLKQAIENYKGILQENIKTIAEMQEYIDLLNTKNSNIYSQIKTKTAFIEDCKEKLKPLFEELASFYKHHHINVK